MSTHSKHFKTLVRGLMAHYGCSYSTAARQLDKARDCMLANGPKHSGEGCGLCWFLVKE